MKIDLFCRVVDNFGDAGVSVRLARQLANEEGCAVRLWINDLDCLARLWPALDPLAAAQHHAGVEIRRWAITDVCVAPDADLVVDVFGGGLPMGFPEAMAKRARPPVWVILEYLTAEDFAVDCHALPSPQPKLPLTRHFFFPGFSPGTGGLPRERGLDVRRRAFQDDADATSAYLERIGVTRPPVGPLVSLFCYDNPALPALVAAWESGDTPLHCLVPFGSRDSVLHAFGLAGRVGETVRRSSLTAQTIPFVDQDDYDRLLWCCDLNFVRGEDSFLRAQWAHRAFIWQPYVQEGSAHLSKLGAFLDRYLSSLNADTARTARRMFEAWNGVREIESAWPAFAASLPELAAHAAAWESRLVGLGSLASNLVSFYKNTVKSLA